MSEEEIDSKASQLPTPSENLEDDRQEDNEDNFPVMSSSTSGPPEPEPEPESNTSASSESHSSSDDQYFVEPTTPFRVLCLHDEMSNAGELSDVLDGLGRRLYDNHAIELVFINSPLLARTSDRSKKSDKPSPSEASTSGDPNGDGDVGDNTIQNMNARIWWEEVSATSAARCSTNTTLGTNNGEGDEDEDDDDSDKNDSDTKDNQSPSSSSPIHGDDGGNDGGNDDDNEASTTNVSDNKHYLGLDASLLLLRQIWSSQPFWGILAVGQGASVAMLLALLPDIKHRPSFSIFVEGTTVLDDDEELLLDDDGGNAMPCLHILGEDPNENTQRLVRQFGGEVSSGVHRFSNVSMNRIGKFLVAQKKGLKHDPGNATILALQNQLFWVEQQAAHLVAKEIAANPPKPLMAVISPKGVGGFGGSKRQDLAGGGAPCPSEFLLQREKRTTNPNGPARHHPSQPQGQKE